MAKSALVLAASGALAQLGFPNGCVHLCWDYVSDRWQGRVGRLMGGWANAGDS